MVIWLTGFALLLSLSLSHIYYYMSNGSFE